MRTVAADKFIRAARGADKALISDVTVFDVFTGGNLGEGMRSLALEVTLQPKDKTLTDEEMVDQRDVSKEVESEKVHQGDGRQT
jgi:phenylalanyl-tRNA synthetase beta chain